MYRRCIATGWRDSCSINGIDFGDAERKSMPMAGRVLNELNLVRVVEG